MSDAHTSEGNLQFSPDVFFSVDVAPGEGDEKYMLTTHLLFLFLKDCSLPNQSHGSFCDSTEIHSSFARF